MINLNIDSLYTNISQEEAIVLYLFLENVNITPKKCSFHTYSVLRFVLKNSVLKFDDLVYRQLCGVAMGVTLAQALVTIYTGEPEEDYIQTRRKKPLL